MLKRLLCLALLALATSVAPAQDERQRALQLMHDTKVAEARPLLEKLVAADPNDVEVQTQFGFCLLLLSQSTADPQTRKAMRVQARSHLLKARQLGNKEPLLDTALDSIPADGSSVESKFSKSPHADQAMQEGETAYTSANFEGALAAYQKALELDPHLYEAALFAGDTCFRLKRWPGAEDYYAKAVAIDPERETAYRYWGNTLSNQGKTDAARSKYIEGIVRDPYNRLAWTGIRNLGKFTHPQFPALDPASVQGNQIQINVNQADDAALLAMTYSMARAAHPGKGRHSLAEETQALDAVCQIAKEKKLTTNPDWLPLLLSLHQAGLLEAYVLLGRPDNGIAQDYEAYAKTHRPQLIRYLSEYYR
ncbi:MAG: tetratricopeptide repeat protein [Candidatus Eremiobacteraeota bacterium]|nr:tetratricopeptide repeat protein [Candidatus Eremiobacteraeota bacterium]